MKTELSVDVASMTRMFDPPHPGEVLREYLGQESVEELATRLAIDPQVLSGVLACNVDLSSDLAARLGKTLGTSAKLWSEMQRQFDHNRSMPPQRLV